LPVAHPDNPAIQNVTIGILSAPATTPDADLKNAAIVSTNLFDWQNPATWTGALDRSPCGTGTCAQMAVLYAKGKLKLHQAFRHAGILDTVFTGKLIQATRVGSYHAVVPTITGTAWLTGMATYGVDPDDPFPNGFTIGDIWGAV